MASLIFARILRNSSHVLRVSNGEITSLSRLLSPSSTASSIASSPHTAVSVGFHTSAVCWKKTPSEAMEAPRKWPAYNTIVLDPQAPTEPRRPAQCFHQRTQIKYSQMHMWYCARMIRGLSIDDALTQLTFNKRKGAHIIKEILLEAQEKALKEQNFEFKSKMYVAESFSTRGTCVKGIRRHGKGRIGQITWVFCHYFVKLEEGDPPKDYYPVKRTVKEQAMDHIEKLRRRRVNFGL